MSFFINRLEFRFKGILTCINKAKINIPGDASREDMMQIAASDETIKELTEGKNVVKTIAVPGRLINIVVKG